MIISRTPFRVSLAGGGSDFAEYYRQRPGNVVTMAINQYMYVTVNRRFGDTIRVSYTRTEIVEHVDDLHHDLIREAMKLTGLTKGLEITTIADLPAGIGPGSSLTLTVGALNALWAMKGERRSPGELARQACEIEIEVLGTCCSSTRGVHREAGSVLSEARRRLEARQDTRTAVDGLVALAASVRQALVSGRVGRIGAILDESWKLKKQMASNVSNSRLDDLYEMAQREGADGGKISGAGAGGCLLVFAKRRHHKAIREAMCRAALRQISFDCEPEGTRIIHFSN